MQSLELYLNNKGKGLGGLVKNRQWQLPGKANPSYMNEQQDILV